MAKYQSELMTCTNLSTGKVTYYVSKCDVFQRVSLRDYLERYESADGLSCMYVKASKTHRRDYRTVTYYH